jgi:hypothetical protein
LFIGGCNYHIFDRRIENDRLVSLKKQNGNGGAILLHHPSFYLLSIWAVQGDEN